MIEIAKGAGFCFGVKRATDALEDAIKKGSDERLYTLGELIHNNIYNRGLEEMGVRVTDISEIPDLAESADANSPVRVFVRAHGITRQDEAILKERSEKNPYFSFVDCTCPFVKKIHKIAAENSSEENLFILIGKATHPEVIGIMSYFDYDKVTFETAEDMKLAAEEGFFEKYRQKTPIMAAQTTQNLSEWKKSQEILKKLYTNPLIFDTICSVTENRQTEAEALAARSDVMIVIGGAHSSNTAKLYDICKKFCPQAVWIERPSDLDELKFIITPHTKVGIAAGASTPSGIIQEVYETMSEVFEELLESSFKTIKQGDIVTGSVTNVTDTELTLDLGAQVTGYIKAEQITDDTSVKLTDMFKKGDEIEARVTRLSDVDGIAELSKKSVDAAKNWQKIVDACENGDVLVGKVAAVVKGGVNVLVNSNQVFVPASHTGVPKDGDLASIKGNEVKIKIIEIKGNRAVGSIRLVIRDERRAAEEAFWASMEEGKVFTGVVKSLTSYGAFVDLGGVDGMVHKTELSWSPIVTPADVVSVGQELTVFVKSFDAEKKRISLGYKTDDTNPWYIFTGKYAVGDVASVKIVNMMPFGAFAEIVDGVDGLIHISQIAQQRIAKPADVLELGQVVDAKIIAIDEENQKVSLSIRALLDESQAEAEAMPVDVVEEAAEEPVEETAEEATEEATEEAAE